MILAEGNEVLHLISSNVSVVVRDCSKFEAISIDRRKQGRRGSHAVRLVLSLASSIVVPFAIGGSKTLPIVETQSVTPNNLKL